MREITFRAWNKQKQKMYQADGIHWQAGIVDVFDEEDDEEYSFDLDNGNIELMQYTGLKDKNGVEIYEGDIIKRTTRSWAKQSVHEIVFRDYRFAYTNKYYGCIALNQAVLANQVIEVIGNIYENSDIISQTKEA